MTPEQKKTLEDLKAFIEFALESNMTYWSALGTIGHDVNGLFNEDATFLPRTSGYKERVSK